MSDKKPLNVYQRWAAVRKACDAVVKSDKRVEVGGGFNPLSHVDVKDAVEPLLGKHGLVVEQHSKLVVDATGEPIITGEPLKSKDGHIEGFKRDILTLEFTHHVVNIDEPKDRFAVSQIVQWRDQSGGAATKAASSALKNFFLTNLQLKVSDTHEDHDPKTGEVKTEPEEGKMAPALAAIKGASSHERLNACSNRIEQLKWNKGDLIALKAAGSTRRKELEDVG